MANIKNTVLIRTDLDLPLGLMAAQVAHIAMESTRKLVIEGKEIVPNHSDWLFSPYLYVHKVPNKEWLLHYIEEAKKQQVDVSTWYDTLYLKSSNTQQIAFKDVLVGASFGPDDSDKIKSIIGDLPLL